MEFHQVIAGARLGDAITNQAFEIRSLLRRFGPSEIFALQIEPLLGNEVFPLNSYPQNGSSKTPEKFLIVHASIGAPEVLAFLLSRPERLMLVYHNISPSESSAPFDPEFARLLEEGRRELEILRDRTEVALAVSAFNARELQALGYRDVRVSPLIVDVKRLLAVEPEPLTINHFRKKVEGPVVLFVGQLLPHKRPDLLVQAYHVLASYLVPEAYLYLVGPAWLESYQVAVISLIESLNLRKTGVIGAVSLKELVAYYREADVFVTLSEHEGFCVPLIEAMAFEIPVVARAHAAIPDTLGDAGLLLPSDADPFLVAEAMAEVISNPSLGDELKARGRKRLASFDPEAARAEFLQHLHSVI
jgi:glycosyltransferase involved in cell wall biosynthesis